ncbi:MAG: BBP7 family outer membrane beta-barrel protein [Pirellulaceae bacterium]
MIARITNIAVALTILGLFQGTARAQEESPGPTAASGILVGDGGNAEVACTECGDPSYGDEWVSTRRWGLQHHPNCSCPRCHPRHAWGSFDALLWWGKGRSTPPLVSNGVLPAATVLFGDGTAGSDLAAGARADFGFWFDDCETLGVGAKVWGLDGDSDGYEANSADVPNLARPFSDWGTAPPGEAALPVSRVDVQTSTDVLAAEAYLRSGVLAGRGYSVDLIGGYHFMRLDDELSIFSTTQTTLLEMLDNFNTQNEFHGGSIGVVGEIRHGRWTTSGLAKFSVGNMHQSVRIDGSNSFSGVGTGGMLAQPTNMGEYARDVTAFIPEIGVTTGYDVRNWLRLTVGYNFLWISNVALAGNQVDYGVDSSQFGGQGPAAEARPAFTFQEDEYWLHGLTLGATLMY